MANAEALYETLDVILANREAWDQDFYLLDAEKFHRTSNIGECGTTQCVAGFRCLMDGLLPVLESSIYYVDPSTGREVAAFEHAQRRFDLTCAERHAIFNYYTDDLADLKARVDEVVAGEWHDTNDGDDSCRCGSEYCRG
jgi:hypothetical protein